MTNTLSKSSKNKENKADNNIDQNKRDFMVLAASGVAAVGAAAAAWPFIDYMNPADDVLALSSIEVDLSTIEKGQSITVMWRGKPVFVRRRTEKEIETAKKDDAIKLRDPQKDSERVKDGNDEWLILVGICTHLGCVPLGYKGDFDGWFCPCHGSHYDTSGRIRRGPAPKNMAVPDYKFLDKTTIKIG